ncbi:family 1 glycosylhydrolase [Candidatus Parvarchaeota archaeon]|nr:family 1 glycosylhydrolase [Candidatus Parvarchaeota archaeon]
MLVGTSTSAHQVEGNNKSSDWWHFEQTNRLKHKSGSGCDQYRLYKKDIDLMKSLGYNAYRFSIEFARVMPHERSIDQGAVKHYKDMIEYMKQKDIEPIPTLWHYTLPLWFSRKGGFEKRKNFKYFFDYVNALLEAGLDVRYILTINEPVIFSTAAYLSGLYPPFVRSFIKWNRVMLNLFALHNEVYDILKSYGYRVSFANNFVDMKSDLIFSPVTKLIDYLMNQRPLLFTRFDFIAINYYHSIDAIRYLVYKIYKGRKRVEFLDAKGLYNIIRREYSLFKKPIMITENGLDTLDDDFRCRFIKDHFESVLSARRSGVPVLGYLHWSFIDNFEWTYGYNKNFGVVGFDMKTKRRIPKKSAYVLGELARENRG